MRRRGLGEDGLLGTVYPDTTVLVLRFFDDLALAAPADAEQQVGIVGQIVAALQEITRRLEVRYVKIMTNEIVAAEGFDGDGHARRGRAGRGGARASRTRARAASPGPAAGSTTRSVSIPAR